ncbi:hypothetical protein C8R44DRAFT_726640 [Mycena epipterygia]|nr:hypothetical protein C8R44DRAFT_726640 [Mycena epipterygia]
MIHGTAGNSQKIRGINAVQCPRGLPLSPCATASTRVYSVLSADPPRRSAAEPWAFHSSPPHSSGVRTSGASEEASKKEDAASADDARLGTGPKYHGTVAVRVCMKEQLDFEVDMEALAGENCATVVELAEIGRRSHPGIKSLWNGCSGTADARTLWKVRYRAQERVLPAEFSPQAGWDNNAAVAPV